MSTAKNSLGRGPLGLSRRGRVGAYAVLVAWSAIVLLPIYWMATTSFKTPLDVNAGPVYLPAVDYEASTDAWDYIVNEEPQTARAFFIASVLTAADAQTMPMLVVAQNATRGPQWWNMSVLILIMSVPVVLMAGVLERFIARGLLVGAVKG